MLCVENLFICCGGKIVLEGFELELWFGEMFGVFGFNGVGKSILFGVFCGELELVEGLVLFDECGFDDWLGVVCV